ncbi:MAG: InlB B-repeat-containing protein, partial [Acholeplasmataceae bacterium]|nr:InlB B-repeat-containing protein [Acholeplasmataceae bacterium]
GTFSLRLAVKSIEVHKFITVDEPVDVTFDLNYDDADEPTIVTIEKDELVTQPSDPTRAGFTFLGWALFGETDLFDFNTPITEDITLVALWEEIVIMTIAEAAAKEVNEEVLFVGVVTGFDGWNTTFLNWSKAFMEDETGTIVLHNPALPIDVEIGDIFHVDGKIGNFNGLIQVAQGATYTPAEGDFVLPAPEVITDLDVLDNVLYQGRRVSLSGEVVSVTTSGQEMVIELDGKTITVRARTSSGVINDLFKDAVVGQTVNITEIHVDWNFGPRLFPISVNQFEFVELTDMEKLEAAKVIMEETFEGKTFDMGTAVPTPSLGDEAITVEDIISDPIGAIVVVEEVQVWDDVTENTVYTISLTLKLGVEELAVSVTVTVNYVDSSEPQAVVLYETSFETSTAKTSYATGTMDDEGTEWTLSEAVRGNLADDKKIGSWAIRGRGPGYARINNAYNNLTQIEFNYAHYGSLTLGVLSFEVSADGGTTWINVWTMPEGTQSTL